ncbi:MAG TPA: hypothetical protein VEA99_20085, partial [Gemmatimonadaceae bacterium]|nr:hypothetical protein [Gemmatimonadaceae bacterium]
MTLRSRFALSLLTIAVALLVPLVLAVVAVRRVEGELTGLREGEFAASLALGQLREGLQELRLADTRMFALRDSTALLGMQQSTSALQRHINQLDRLKLERIADTLRLALGEITPNVEREYELAVNGQWDAADSISESVVTPAIERALSGVQMAEMKIRETTADRVGDARDSIKMAQFVSSAALGIALLLT